MLFSSCHDGIDLLLTADLDAFRTGELQHITADGAKEFHVLLCLGTGSDHCDILSFIQHAVTGRAIADALSNILVFSLVSTLTGNAGGNDHRCGLMEIISHCNTEGL